MASTLSSSGDVQPADRAAARSRSLTSEQLQAADYLAPRTLRPHLWLAVCFFVPLSGCGLVWGATYNVGQVNTMVGNAGLDPLLASAFAAMSGLILLIWIVSTFRPLRESLADRAVVLEGAAHEAELVAARIGASVDDRCGTPFAATRQELDGIPAITLRNGAEYGMITVRPVGADLVVAWSMWRRRSTARLIGQLLNNLTEPAREAPYSVAAISSFVLMHEQLECVLHAALDGHTR